jgi:hypothetical protein
MSNSNESISLPTFASYALLTISLLYLIVSTVTAGIIRAGAGETKVSTRTFIGLAIIALSHSSFYAFKTLCPSFVPQESQPNSLLSVSHVASQWSIDSSLVEQLWSINAVNWWWREQLYLFTAGSWAVFLYFQGRRHHIPHIWAYMLLGQIFSVSVATSLFYLAVTVISAPPAQVSNFSLSSEIVPPRLWLPVLLSLLSTGIIPFAANTPWFLAITLTIPVLLMIPFLPLRITPSTSIFSANISYTRLLMLTAIASLLLRLQTIESTIRSFGVEEIWSIYPMVWETLFENTTQSWVAWDVLWASVAFIIWQVCGGEVPDMSAAGTAEGVWWRKVSIVVSSGCGMGAVSVGVIAPFSILMQTEYETHVLPEKRVGS